MGAGVGTGVGTGVGIGARDDAGAGVSAIAAGEGITAAAVGILQDDLIISGTEDRTAAARMQRMIREKFFLFKVMILLFY